MPNKGRASVSDALIRMLGDLAKLPACDRDAILQRLSLEQRRLIASIAATPKPAARSVSTKPALPSCSPWLAKRMTTLLHEREGATLITPASRDALHLAMAALAPTSAK